MNPTVAARAASDDFREARRKALLGGILDMIRRHPSELLSLEEVRRRIHIRGQRYLGHQTVSVNHIVGSEGRYADFDRRFLPLSDTLKQRWSSIGTAWRLEVHLPPVELYKIGDIYFVRDGNHRVSVGRLQGQTFIDAYVTELLVDVPLTPNLSVRDLLLKEEYSDFLEWTNLHDLRPDERIEFSELGGYLQLVKHINVHHFYMGQEQQRDISREEAVLDWYDHVYMPIVQVIREQEVLKYFPRRTEADLYLWIMDHRWYMRERTGADPGPDAATSEYVELFGQKGLADTIGGRLRSALQLLGVRL